MHSLTSLGKSFSYAPERLSDDLYCIPLPLHDGSPVNTFVIVTPDGVRLIDGGLDTPHCQARLASGLREMGFAVSDIRALLITHGHPDHVGAANVVAANGAEVVAHRLETTIGRRIEVDDAWLYQHGLPDPGPETSAWARPFDWPAPTCLVEDGDVLRWGKLELQVLWCPGHTPGLVCLYEPTRRLLFTTDHVMRRAPSPISLRQNTAANPLAAYLASIRKLTLLPVETVLPGHGRPFTGLGQRLVHIEREIEHQLDAIRARLQRGPATAYQLLSVPGLRPPRATADRYALSMVLARLRYLELNEEILLVQEQDLFLWRAASAATRRTSVG